MRLAKFMHIAQKQQKTMSFSVGLSINMCNKVLEGTDQLLCPEGKQEMITMN